MASPGTYQAAETPQLPPLVRLTMEAKRRGMAIPPPIDRITSEYRRRSLDTSAFQDYGNDQFPYNAAGVEQAAMDRYNDEYMTQEQGDPGERQKYVSNRTGEWINKIEDTLTVTPGHLQQGGGERLTYDQRSRLYEQIGEAGFQKKRDEFGAQYDAENSPEARYIRDRDSYGNTLAANYRQAHPEATDSEVYNHMHRELARYGYNPSYAGQLGAVVDRRELAADLAQVQQATAPLVDQVPGVLQPGVALGAGAVKSFQDGMATFVGTVGAGGISEFLERTIGDDLGFRDQQAAIETYWSQTAGQNFVLGTTTQEGARGAALRFTETMGQVAGDLATTIVASSLGASGAKLAGLNARLSQLSGQLSGMGFMGAKEGGGAYRTIRDQLIAKGYSPEEANRRGLYGGIAVAVVNSLLEKAPIDAFVFANPQTINRLKGALRGLVVEGTQEAAQETVNILAEFESGAATAEVVSWDNARRLATAALAGGIVGGGLGVATGGAGARADVTQEAQDEARAEILARIDRAERAQRQAAQARESTQDIPDTKAPEEAPKPEPTPPTGTTKPSPRNDPKILPTGRRMTDWYHKTYGDTPSTELKQLVDNIGERFQLAEIPIELFTGDPNQTVDPEQATTISKLSPQEIADLPPLIAFGNTSGQLQVVDGNKRLAGLRMTEGVATIKSYVPASVAQEIAAGTFAPQAQPTRPEGEAPAPEAGPEAGPEAPTPEAGQDVSPTEKRRDIDAEPGTPQWDAQALGITYQGHQFAEDGIRIVGDQFTDPQTGTSFIVKPGDDVRLALIAARKRFKEGQEAGQPKDPRVRNLKTLAEQAIKAGDVESMRSIQQRLAKLRKTVKDPYGASSERAKDTLRQTQELIDALETGIGAAKPEQRLEQRRTTPEEEAAPPTGEKAEPTEEPSRAERAEQAFEREYDLARRDPLTGIANLRAANEQMQDLMDVADRRNKPIAIGAIDLVLFKQINDVLGHDVGDKALVAAARAIEDTVRTTTSERQGDVFGIVARLGGDEFEFALYDVTAEQAVMVGERMQAAYDAAMKAQGIELPGGLKTALGFGFTIRKAGAAAEDSIEVLRKEADTDLTTRKAELKARAGLQVTREEAKEIIRKAQETEPPAKEPTGPPEEMTEGVELQAQERAWIDAVTTKGAALVWEPVTQQAKTALTQGFGATPLAGLKEGDRLIVTKPVTDKTGIGDQRVGVRFPDGREVFVQTLDVAPAVKPGPIPPFPTQEPPDAVRPREAEPPTPPEAEAEPEPPTKPPVDEFQTPNQLKVQKELQGKIAHHFTTPEAAAKLLAGEPFDQSNEPQHKLMKGKSGEVDTGGRFAPGEMYLSLDDERWGTTSDIDESIPAVEIGMGKDDPKPTEDDAPFYDYEKQKWMMRPGALKRRALTPVQVRIKPNAKILVLDSPEAVVAATQLFGPHDTDAFWERVKAFSPNYDAVAILNSEKYRERNANKGWRFFDAAGGDQVIVLNQDAVEVVRPTQEPPDAVRPGKAEPPTPPEAEAEPEAEVTPEGEPEEGPPTEPADEALVEQETAVPGAQLWFYPPEDAKTKAKQEKIRTEFEKEGPRPRRVGPTKKKVPGPKKLPKAASNRPARLKAVSMITKAAPFERQVVFIDEGGKRLASSDGSTMLRVTNESESWGDDGAHGIDKSGLKPADAESRFVKEALPKLDQMIAGYNDNAGDKTATLDVDEVANHLRRVMILADDADAPGGAMVMVNRDGTLGFAKGGRLGHAEINVQDGAKALEFGIDPARMLGAIEAMNAMGVKTVEVWANNASEKQPFIFRGITPTRFVEAIVAPMYFEEKAKPKVVAEEEEEGGPAAEPEDRIYPTRPRADFAASEQSADDITQGPEKGLPDWIDQPPGTGEGRKLVGKFKNDPQGGKVGMRSIVDYVNGLMDLEMRVGREQTTATHPAHFTRRYFMVRTRVGASQINFHEAGHGLSELLRDRNPKWWKGHQQKFKRLTTRKGSMASAESPEEGMAEFIRLSIVDPNALPANLVEVVNNRLLSTFPDVLSGLRDAARMYKAHAARSSLAKMRSYQSDGPKKRGLIPRIHDTWSYLLAQFGSAEAALDERLIRPTFNAIEKISLQIAQEFYGSIKDTDADPKLAYQSTIRTPVEVSRAMDGPTNKKSQEGIRVLVNEGWERALTDKLTRAGFDVPKETPKRGEYLYLSPKSFAAIVEDVGEDNWADFETYGWAKAALSRAVQKQLVYPGLTEDITPGQLKKIIGDFEKDHPTWKSSFKDIEYFMNQMLLVSVLSGEKSVDDVIRIKSAFEDYWPLPRKIERGMFSRRFGGGAKPSSLIRSAHGSFLPFASINDAVRDRVAAAFQAYYDNRAMLAVRNYGNEMAKQKDIPKEVRTLGARAMTKLHLDSKKMATLSKEEMQKVVASYLDSLQPPGTMPIDPERIGIVMPGFDVWRSVEPNAINVVAPFERGQRDYYQIEDPVLFGLFARARDPGAFLGFVSKLGQPIVKPWKRLITNNLAFSVFNARRDSITAMTLGDKWQSYLPGFYAATGIVNRITGKAPQAVEASELLSRALDETGTRGHRTLSQRFREVLYEDLVPANWSTSTTTDKLLALPGIANAAVLKPVDMFLWATGQRFLSRYVEALGREGAFSIAQKQGMSTEAAQDIYDRISGNFGARPLSPGASSVYRLAGFLNPGLQIVYQQYARWTHPDPDVRRQTVMAKLPTIALYSAVAAAINYLLMSDDDRERLKERPDEERMRDMAIFGKFKFPFEYGVIGAIESFAWNTVEGHLLDDMPSAKAQAHEILKKAMDLPGHPMSFSHPWLKTWLELEANYSWFFGDEIVPSTLQLAYPQNPELQFYPSTPETYKAIGKLAGKSPLKIQYLVRNAFSSQLDQAIKAAEAVVNGAKRINQAGDLPFIGRLFTRDPRGWRAQSVKDVAEAEKQYRYLRSAIGQMVEEDDPDPGEFDQLNREMDKLETAHWGYQEIQRLGRYIRAEQKRDNPDQDLVKRYEAQMVKIAQNIQEVREREEERKR